MKKLISRVFQKAGYIVVNQYEFDDLKNSSRKVFEFAQEIYHLARETKLQYLAPQPSERLLLSISSLIGTSPFEGLSILNKLHKTYEIEGDICEFGIAQGATSRLIATWMLDENSKKKLWLFDSFQGLSTPTKEDKLKDDIFNLGSMDKYDGKMAYTVDVARKKLESIHFPEDQLVIIPGFIEDSIRSRSLPQSVSFAYVDFDLYSPIKTALQYLYSVLSKGGVIIVDDYDFFSTGAKTVVDEFMESKKDEYTIEIPDQNLGYFCILTRK